MSNIGYVLSDAFSMIVAVIGDVVKTTAPLLIAIIIILLCKAVYLMTKDNFRRFMRKKELIKVYSSKYTQSDKETIKEMALDTAEREIYKEQIISMIDVRIKEQSKSENPKTTYIHNVVVDYDNTGIYFGSKVRSYGFYGYLTSDDVFEVKKYATNKGYSVISDNYSVHGVLTSTRYFSDFSIVRMKEVKL